MEPNVLVKRVYCGQCGAEARQWRTAVGDVRLPAVLLMSEVRANLNSKFTMSAHPGHGQVFAELEPA